MLLSYPGDLYMKTGLSCLERHSDVKGVLIESLGLIIYIKEAVTLNPFHLLLITPNLQAYKILGYLICLRINELCTYNELI